MVDGGLHVEWETGHLVTNSDQAEELGAHAAKELIDMCALWMSLSYLTTG
jgi:hypothetical protein